MNIRYSVPLNLLVNDNGDPLQNLWELAYGDVPEIVFAAVNANNEKIDLSDALVWQIAIDADRDSQTMVLCETSDIVYSSDEKTLSFSISTKTLAFLNAVNGKSKISLIAEMSGFDGSGNRIFRFHWNMTGAMPVDANTTVPDSPTHGDGSQTKDFTAFRVYADDTDDHTQTYAVGSYCPQFVPDNILFRHASGSALPQKLQELYQTTTTPTEEQIRNALGYICGHAIPKSMTERFVLNADVDWENSDVIVDWGDGTKSYMKNGKTQVARGIGFYDSSDYVDDGGETHYMFSHTYEQSGAYYIKITGRNYWGVRHYYADLKNADGSSKYPDNSINYKSAYSLVYECLGNDTPVAGCVSNLAHFMDSNLRILHVFMTPCNMHLMRNVGNWSGAFYHSQNLISSRGMNFGVSILTGVRSCSNAFRDCKSMEIFSGSLPACCTTEVGYCNVFNGCLNLRANIASIIPACGFLSKKLSAEQIFINCAKMTGTVPAALLWEDQSIVWTNTAEAFSGCSASIRAQVPTSWGGTNDQIQ